VGTCQRLAVDYGWTRMRWMRVWMLEFFRAWYSSCDVEDANFHISPSQAVAQSFLVSVVNEFESVEHFGLAGGDCVVCCSRKESRTQVPLSQ
jgi:hypothetical protein